MWNSGRCGVSPQRGERETRGGDFIFDFIARFTRGGGFPPCLFLFSFLLRGKFLFYGQIQKRKFYEKTFGSWYGCGFARGLQ